VTSALNLELRCASSQQWLDAVLADFDSFLLDHAANERKASATAMNFVVRYPDRQELVPPMIALAIEELQHFEAVHRVLAERGLRAGADEKDLYVGDLLAEVRSSGDGRLLDRLVVGAVVEARGCERFGLIAEALPGGELRDFYRDIAASEQRHWGLYLELAAHWFDAATVRGRLDSFLELEAAVIARLPVRPRLH
jgi:tRNA-(ms[2]io[6]A)-hydroxylase